MSCLDVMYHQTYGAHYLPAAAAYKAAYYHHQQQQRKLSVYSKMQECVEQHQQRAGGGGGILPRDQAHRRGPDPPAARSARVSESASKDGTQPAEAEYLSSRCVLFTYFQGDIGDVVDQHFSRALSQASSFTGEAKPIRVTQPPAAATPGFWKDGVSLSEGQSSSVWNSAYPAQASPCLPSIHPDFSPSPVSLHPTDGALWSGHALSPAGLTPPASLPDAWAYSLNPQSAGGYPHVHDIYHSHPHVRHAHHVLHSYPAHGPALDPRFGPLLLPGVRNQSQAVASTPGSHSEGVKMEMDPSSSSPIMAPSATWTPSAHHRALDVYDSALDQDKAKTSVWF